MKLIMIFTVFALIFPTTEALANGRSDKTVPITLEEIIKRAKGRIEFCSTAITLDQMTRAMERSNAFNKARVELRFAEIDRGHYSSSDQDIDNKAKELAASKMQPSEESKIYKDCHGEIRQSMINEGKALSKSKPKLSAKLKDMVAQWLTAMDSIGNSNFQNENSKFETLANRLLVE